MVYFITNYIKTFDRIWNVESPSGSRCAIVRKLTDKKNEEKQYIEVWSVGNKTMTISVDKLKAHGKIYNNDGHFGSFCWSKCEGQLLYVAEKKCPKTASYLEKKSDDDEEKKDADIKSEKEEPVKGDVHVYTDTWGEQLSKKSHSVLCVLNLDTQHVRVMENVPSNVSPGQALWGPDDAGIVFIGWNQSPWRLGLIYCQQRASSLYYLDFQSSQCKELSINSQRSILSTAFNAQRTRLFYLDGQQGGEHSHSLRLMMYDWETEEISVLVDVVNSYIIGSDDFPGIYTYGLKQHCVSSDDSVILLSTQWGFTREIIAVNIDTKDVIPITKTKQSSDSIGCWTLCDINQDYMLVCCSSPNQPPFLMLGYLPSWSEMLTRRDTDEGEIICWHQLDTYVPRWGPQKCILSMFKEPMCINSKYPKVGFESVLYMPNDLEPHTLPPLIVYPHGGPHSGSCQAFLITHSLYTMAGYAVLEINYRGSVGYGEDSIHSLPGNIGKQDVQDVYQAVQEVMDKVDVDNIFISGGSHGGFLTTHLIGQYPDMFRAAACRNPVVDIPSMFSTSDIPDWVYVECGLDYDFKSTPSAEELRIMWEKSPIRYIDQVKTPILMCVGEKDLRVPPRQGIYYIRCLQARGVPVRLLTYSEDNHPLSSVDAESDVFINTIAWFRQHARSPTEY